MSVSRFDWWGHPRLGEFAPWFILSSQLPFFVGDFHWFALVEAATSESSIGSMRRLDSSADRAAARIRDSM